MFNLTCRGSSQHDNHFMTYIMSNNTTARLYVVV